MAVRMPRGSSTNVFALPPFSLLYFCKTLLVTSFFMASVNVSASDSVSRKGSSIAAQAARFCYKPKWGSSLLTSEFDNDLKDALDLPPRSTPAPTVTPFCPRTPPDLGSIGTYPNKVKPSWHFKNLIQINHARGSFNAFVYSWLPGRWTLQSYDTAVDWNTKFTFVIWRVVIVSTSVRSALTVSEGKKASNKTSLIMQKVCAKHSEIV